MQHTELSVQELVEQGKVLYSVENYDEAVSYFTKALSIDPYYEKAYENLGTCYIMMDKYKEARETFEKWEMIGEKNGLVYFHLGNLALLEEKPAEAKAMYSKAELLGYAPQVMSLNLATFYEDAGDYEQAIAQYDKMLRVNPYDYDVMDRKTQFLIRVDRYSAALNSAKKMVQTDIDRFEGHHYLYVCLIMLNRAEEAEKYIQELEARFPDNHLVKFDKIRLLDLLGRTQDALDLLNREFPKVEGNQQLALLKMGLLMQQEKVDEVIDLVSSSEELQKDPEVLTIMYSLYFGKNDFAKALDYCRQIQQQGETSPQYYPAMYFEALAQDKLGNKEEAEKLYRKSIEEYQQAFVKNPAHIDLYMYRCLCEYQLGDYREARSDAEYLLAVSPNVAEFHQVAALIYDKLGMEEQKQAELEKAKELNPKAILPLI